MSGPGAPLLRVEGARDLRVAVIAAQWHEEIMAGLVAGARRALAECEVAASVLVRVPGSFELPVAATAAARAGFDALVCLGVVLRGGTPHFDYVCAAATQGLTAVATDTGVPVGFGVLTCDTEEQARQRAGLAGSTEDKGYDAALAALATALVVRSLEKPQ